MCKRLMCLLFLFVLLGQAKVAFPATILQYSFDGTLGGDVPSSLLDDTGTYTATIIEGSNPASTIKYAAANLTYNTGGTSAEFANSIWSNNAGDTFLVPNDGGIDFSSFDEFTVELFIYPDSSGSGQIRRIFSEYIYAYMYLDESNTLHAIRKWGGGSWNQNWTHLQITNFPHDSWSHLAMTWDADAAGNKFKLYVDGELIASDAGTATVTLDSFAGFTIGGYHREDSSTAQFFAGRIDEFRLSDVALDPGEFLGASPYISFQTASSGGMESLTPAKLTVVLGNAEEGQTYTVDYAVTGGTATAGADYVISGAGPACWNYPTQCHGDTDNDGEVKGSDFLALKASWYKCAPDPDYNPCADFDRDGCVKGSDFLILKSNWYQTVEPDCPSEGGPSTLQFDPGQTSKTIRIDIVDDGINEDDETVEVTLSNATGPNVELGPVAKHTYTITDSLPKISFGAESSSGKESVTPVMIPVNLSHASGDTITVDYAVTGGTATGGGVDYTLADGTLQFGPREVTRYISIDIADDEIIETDETIELTLSNPTNATLGLKTQHTYLIRDNESGVVFDGMVWYCSESSNCLTVSDDELIWDARKGGQIVARLPEQRFSQVGDIVIFQYIWTSTGDVDYSCECYKDYNPDPDIYDYCTDIRCVGGTGDFRIGLFDSAGKGYITADNMGVNNEIFRDYLGYHFRVFPHVPQDAPSRFTEHKTGGGSESHTNTSIWERNKPYQNSALLSNSNSWNRIDQPLTGGFGLPVGGSSLLTIQLQRFSATQVRMSISCNGKTWTKYSETPSVIPDKIDVFAMYSNSGEYDYVRLAVPEP